MPTAAIDDHLLTTKQACAKLGVGRTTLYQREKAGLIRAVRDGRSIRWWASEVIRHGAAPSRLAPVEAVSAPVAKESFSDRRERELMKEYKIAPTDGERHHWVLNRVQDEVEYRDKHGLSDDFEF